MTVGGVKVYAGMLPSIFWLVPTKLLKPIAVSEAFMLY